MFSMHCAWAMRTVSPERPDGNAAPPGVRRGSATLNRYPALLRLLRQRERQARSYGRFEVVVVDDGSTLPVASALDTERLGFHVTVLRSERTGAAAARHRGIGHAVGEIVVVLDDDIQIERDFLAQHLALHPAGSRNAVLGWIRPDPAIALPIFERFHADVLERFAADVCSGRLTLQGTHLATANVSFRRADYLAVGGFDPALKHSEDAELGVRLEKSGVMLKFADRAAVIHSSDHTSLAAWLRRAFLYGLCDLQIAAKHDDVPSANPWRYLWAVHPASRLLLAAGVVMPSLMHVVARTGMRVASAIDRLGACRAAIKATTVVYGIEYFRGVRHGSGSLRGAIAGLRQYASVRRAPLAGGHGC